MKNLIELYKTDRPTAKMFTGLIAIYVGLAVVMIIELIDILIR